VWRPPARLRQIGFDLLISGTTPIAMVLIAHWIRTRLSDTVAVEWVIKLQLAIWGNGLMSGGVCAWLVYAAAYLLVALKARLRAYDRMRLLNASVPAGLVCPWGIFAAVMTVIDTTSYSLS
jgi:hypothetical protein